jgi:hypothetical protein
MKRKSIRVMVFAGLFLPVLIALALAEDRFTLITPNGIAFSEFRGYESWQYVEPHQTKDRIKIIAANPVMIAAYKDGFPANRKPVPDGAMFVKLEWANKPSPELPTQATVAGALQDVEFMVKDSKRFPATNGWGYADFKYDAASSTFTPYGTASTAKTFCHQCHTAVQSKDFVFSTYPTR